MRAPALLFVLSLLVLNACRKDPALPIEEVQTGTTPLALEIPLWALNQPLPLNLPADNPLTLEGVALGRKLFYEKALSDNYSMSCGSCHQQQFAFTDPRRFSLGTDGSEGRRNSMSVQNMLWDHFFFRDGRSGRFEQQALGPVVNHVELRNTLLVV